MQSKYFYIFILVISLLVSAYFIRSTLSLYSAKNTLSFAEDNLKKLKDENTQIKKEIEYRKTDQYIINEAREKLNYGFNGERIIIVPKDRSDDSADVSPNVSELRSSSNGVQTKKIDSSIIEMWLRTFF